MERKRLFNDNWEFAKTPYGTEREELKAREKEFQPVDIPHDWLIYHTEALYETSTGWYRKRFTAPEEAGHVLLRFDGVYMDSAVYINGKPAGEWKYGYSAFEFDITALLQKGENLVQVRVNHHEPNSRWYSGAGIFRNVWLKCVPKAYLASDGIYIVTKKLSSGNFSVSVRAEIAGEAETVGAASFTIEHDGCVIKKGAMEKAELTLLCADCEIESPLLWDAENPNLYTLTVELDNGDRESVRFGFREFLFDPDRGFVANGKQVKLHGVCEHHDLGCLGAAFHEPAMRRKLVTLKKMGVNAIRTSHNMPAAEFMDLADEMGFYVDSEAFDMWEKPMTEYDYARFFPEWAERDVASWVRRDRNHPSVIMWSIGNEIPDTNEPRGLEVTKMLKDYVEQHDPAHNAMVTIGSNYMPWEGAQKCADVLKLAGYNYAEIHYDSHHEQHPDWIIYGSETSSIVQSRGVYHFPMAGAALTEEDEQCSSLGNNRPSWAAKSVEYCICADRDRDYAAGQFLWTGHDYIGEPTPYKTKNSYFGQIDTAGFPKDSFYMYQAEWTDYRKSPMVHLFPYWDFSQGQLIDIRVCTNAPQVEVFVNEKSLGRMQIDHAHGEVLFPAFQVAYEPGAIRAAAYDEAGNIVAEDIRKSFGDSARLVLRADKETLRADGEDMIFVEIGTVDKQGNPVDNAMDYVEVEVRGAGRLLGLDNGDSTDYDQYKGTCRKLFNGKLLAVIGAKTEPGDITVTVRPAGSASGVEAAAMTLCGEKAPVREGVSAGEENRPRPLVTGKEGSVPVRKVELVSEGGQSLTEDVREVVVKALLYPAEATDREILFTAVNDLGIKSNLAEVEQIAPDACRITAKGDGSFRLRASSRSGTDKVKIFTSLEFSVSGLGEAYINPYEFVAGSLYNYSKGDVGGFSQNSVASAQEGVSEIGYRGVDFGEYGADEITLPIFAQTGAPHYLQIWEGIPGEEGSEMLADVVYQKPSIWDVYQPETYKLKRRIKGITTLCFVTKDQRYFIKGFSFTRPQKAFAKLEAVECGKIYGDTFSKKEDAVEGIGNNVFLEYDEMDFGDGGFSRITICGRTPLEKNDIHIRFTQKDGESVSRLVEFPHSGEYREVTFSLEPVENVSKVGFLFLPGCDFDFKWFQFS